MKIELHTVERTVSTNADVRRALDEGRAEGYAVLAGEQTGGYGRRGNAWASAPGGMYLSVLLRPGRELGEWPTLSLLTALAVLRAVDSVAPAAARMLRIKPPNDVVVGSAGIEHPHKLAGILPETHAGGVALGIGVNIAVPTTEQHVQGKNTPVYLAELVQAAGDSLSVEQTDPSAFAAVLLECLLACYATWRVQGFEPFAAEYEAAAL